MLRQVILAKNQEHAPQAKPWGMCGTLGVRPFAILGRPFPSKGQRNRTRAGASKPPSLRKQAVTRMMRCIDESFSLMPGPLLNLPKEASSEALQLSHASASGWDGGLRSGAKLSAQVRKPGTRKARQRWDPFSIQVIKDLKFWLGFGV